MRAAAAEQSKQTKGSGRGMMGVILPMYAVGIVVYLVYTLFKVGQIFICFPSFYDFVFYKYLLSNDIIENNNLILKLI